MVRFLAMAGAAFSAMMLAIDCAVGMPLPWTVAEGPYVVVLSTVVMWVQREPTFPLPQPLSLEAGLIIMPRTSITELSLRYGAACTVWL